MAVRSNLKCRPSEPGVEITSKHLCMDARLGLGNRRERKKDWGDNFVSEPSRGAVLFDINGAAQHWHSRGDTW